MKSGIRWIPMFFFHLIPLFIKSHTLYPCFSMVVPSLIHYIYTKKSPWIPILSIWKKNKHVFVSRFSINDCPILSHLNILKSPCFFPLFHPCFHNLDLLIRGPQKFKQIFTSSIPQFWWISYWENKKITDETKPRILYKWKIWMGKSAISMVMFKFANCECHRLNKT